MTSSKSKPSSPAAARSTPPAPREQKVRDEVQALLARSKAFQSLDPERRSQLAADMERVGAYLAEPEWLAAGTPVRARSLAESDPVQDLKGRLSDDPGFAGSDFEGGALRQGTEAFGNLVNKVDFPGFVSGLVQGVFKAVVDASIQQMQAYAELLAATAKTVDQFASDHISDYDAREFVAQRYPSSLELDASGEGPARLRPVLEAEGVERIGRDFGFESDVDFDDGESEQSLVNAAKLEMARSRQQLLGTMVLLGINRIVVTNGQINAKVLFDVQANDEGRRRAQARMDDEVKQSKVHASIFGGSFLGFGGGSFNASNTSHNTLVSSAVDDTSESRAQMKATLSGDVRLSFRSETFPLERMVDAGGLQTLNQRAQPGAPGSAATPAAGGER